MNETTPSDQIKFHSKYFLMISNLCQHNLSKKFGEYIISTKIISILKRVYIGLLRVANRCRWFTQYHMLRKGNKEVQSFISDLNNRFKRILIIAPHADDELIGCYQLIKNQRDKVKLFYCSFIGSNPNESNKVIRLHEFKAFCDEEGVEFTATSDKLEADLKKEIETYLPDVIFLPSCVDWHSEHRKINYILNHILEKLNYSNTIAWYQITVPICEKHVNLFTPLSKSEQQNKWSCFLKHYKTQKHIPIHRFKYAERLSPYKQDCFAAEVYMEMSLYDFKRFLQTLSSSKIEQKANNMVHNINNLRRIKAESTDIYFNLPATSSNGNSFIKLNYGQEI